MNEPHTPMPNTPMPQAPSSRAVQRRQYLLLGGIGALILVGTAVSVSLSEGPASTAPVAKPQTTSILSPGAQVDPRDAWRGQADAQLKAIEQRSRELSQRDNQLEDQGREMLERLSRLEATTQATQTTLPGSTPMPGLTGLTPLPPPPQAAPALRPNFGPDPASGSGMGPGQATLPPSIQPPMATLPPPPGASGGMGMNNARTAQGNASPSPNGIVSIHLDDPKATQNSASPRGNGSGLAGGNGMGTDSSDSNALSVRDTRRYLPSGSFTRALLLGGLDAPTGGQSQRNPQPVLLRLMNHAVLPNRFRAHVKECFVVGAGYGDVSAERAYIRTESLSCVTRQGQAIDVPLKGYVAGEDGKAGMRGRLVSKQGQILANALLAGVASGIGSAFQQGATTVSVSPLGTTGTVDTDKQLQAGLGSGVGKALDRLAQYYITLAEKVFPVIEVDAGRTVDVVITQGLALPEALDGVLDESADATDTTGHTDYPYLAQRMATPRSSNDAHPRP